MGHERRSNANKGESFGTGLIDAASMDKTNQSIRTKHKVVGGLCSKTKTQKRNLW